MSDVALSSSPLSLTACNLNEDDIIGYVGLVTMGSMNPPYDLQSASSSTSALSSASSSSSSSSSSRRSYSKGYKDADVSACLKLMQDDSIGAHAVSSVSSSIPHPAATPSVPIVSGTSAVSANDIDIQSMPPRIYSLL